MLIDFRQFLYDSVEKVLFKADFIFCMTEMQRQTLAHNLHDRNAKANFSTQSEYTVYIICSRTMHNNLNILEMKQVLELQPFILNANRMNI